MQQESSACSSLDTGAIASLNRYPVDWLILLAVAVLGPLYQFARYKYLCWRDDRELWLDVESSRRRVELEMLIAITAAYALWVASRSAPPIKEGR